MRRRRGNLPPLEDGFPIPPPRPRRESEERTKEKSPWLSHILSAEHGQSIKVALYEVAWIKLMASRLGVGARSEKIPNSYVQEDEGIPGHPRIVNYPAARIWFLLE